MSEFILHSFSIDYFIIFLLYTKENSFSFLSHTRLFSLLIVILIFSIYLCILGIFSRIIFIQGSKYYSDVKVEH